jgi:hypothetical protein
MQITGELHDPASLAPREAPSGPIRSEAWWKPRLVLRLYKREKPLNLAGDQPTIPLPSLLITLFRKVLNWALKKYTGKKLCRIRHSL